MSDAIDGESLPLSTRVLVGFHRTVCPFCRRYEKSLHVAIEAGRALRDLPFEDDAADPKK